MGGNLLFDSFSVRRHGSGQPFFRSVPDFSFLIAQHAFQRGEKCTRLAERFQSHRPIV